MMGGRPNINAVARVLDPVPRVSVSLSAVTSYLFDVAFGGTTGTKRETEKRALGCRPEEKKRDHVGL
jgi:hypothetical protein